MNGLNTIIKQNDIAVSNKITVKNKGVFQTRLSIKDNVINILDNRKDVVFEESLDGYLCFDGGVVDYVKNRVSNLWKTKETKSQHLSF